MTFNQDYLDLQKEAWMLRERNFPASIQFDFPKSTKVVSLTGNDCSLNCAHCGGHYLKQMTPVEEYVTECTSDKKQQFSSCLISGGCDSDGKVPFSDSREMLLQLKQQKKMNFHVGLVSEEEAAQLPEICDVVSFDFVGDNETIQEVYGLNKTVNDYLASYRSLRKYVKTLPHICIGLRGGKISGEYKALELLSQEGVDALVFIVFSPTKNTKFADNAPPSIKEVSKIIATARTIFPSTPIHLGCMRPKGRYRAQLDEAAIACGVNKIVVPTKAAYDTASKLGLEIISGEECCVL